MNVGNYGCYNIFQGKDQLHIQLPSTNVSISPWLLLGEFEHNHSAQESRYCKKQSLIQTLLCYIEKVVQQNIKYAQKLWLSLCKPSRI